MTAPRGWMKRIFGTTTHDVPSAPPLGPSAPSEAPVRHSEYMHPDTEAARFTLDGDGLPTGFLAPRRGRLVILADGSPEEMVNPASRRLPTLGLYAFRVRGVSYHADQVRAGNFKPGTRVLLVREPDNEHDPNAVAVRSVRGGHLAGYVNQQNAARIAKRLDAGEELEAVTLRGGGVGNEETPWVLVATPAVMAHLHRML